MSDILLNSGCDIDLTGGGATLVDGVDAIKQFCTHAIVLDHGQLMLDTDNVDEAIAMYLGDDA